MSILKDLKSRSNHKCELCLADAPSEVYLVPPDTESHVDKSILICTTCHDQILDPDLMDSNHWRCLNDCMWSTTPAVQVMSWRLLHRLKTEGWPVDLIDIMYLNEETLLWAQSTGEHLSDDQIIIHKDSHGAILTSGDTITLIKDLNVKGASFTAKRGTPVRNIRLVHDNATHIEGKINGQQIVILTEFVKKSNKSN